MSITSLFNTSSEMVSRGLGAKLPQVLEGVNGRDLLKDARRLGIAAEREQEEGGPHCYCSLDFPGLLSTISSKCIPVKQHSHCKMKKRLFGGPRGAVCAHRVQR